MDEKSASNCYPRVRPIDGAAAIQPLRRMESCAGQFASAMIRGCRHE